MNFSDFNPMKELANTVRAINKPLNVRLRDKYDEVNRLIIIGNGFDLAHGIKSSFNDFLNWYLFQVLSDFFNDKSYEDDLIKINSRSSDILLSTLNKRNGIKAFQEFCKDSLEEDTIWKSEFLHDILEEVTDKNWVDVEKYYFDYLLKINNSPNKQIGSKYSVKRLNRDFELLKYKFVEYLKCETKDFNIQIDERLLYQFSGQIKPDECLPNVINRSIVPEFTCFVNFNYTSIVNEYQKLFSGRTLSISIHGELDGDNRVKQEPIFGFGDELNDDYLKFEKTDDDTLFDHIKSIKYLEFDNYRKLTEFINSNPYQILIFGHSCGISDRTLLNTLFENDNCISIKPFYHQYTLNEGLESDNYLRLSLGIYRQFKSKQLLRDKVVNKEYCEPMIQPFKKQPQN